MKKLVAAFAVLATLLAAAPAAADHENWPPSFFNDPEGIIRIETQSDANFICGVAEKVKIRTFVKAVQNPQMILANHAYNTTGFYSTGNGDQDKHNATYYFPEPDWAMGQGWWLVNTVTLPEGKIATLIHTSAIFDTMNVPKFTGTIWLYHQKRCV